MQRGGPSAMIPVNPFDERARPNPYPVYQYMRTVEPVHRSPVGYWILTRYDDCRAVLEDPRWAHDGDRLLEPLRRPGDPVDPMVRLIRKSIAFIDGQAHEHHRGLLETAMRPAAGEMEVHAAQTANGLVDLLVEKSAGVDLMPAYAAALPLAVLGEIVGLPRADLRQVHQWGRELATGLDPAVQSSGVVLASSAAMGIVEYLQGQIDAARGGKAKGLLGTLAATRPSPMSTWELIADLTMVLVTGVETSCALIGNAVLALLRNPDELSRLRDDPGLIDTAVEELIRFDGPVHLTARVAGEEIALGGVVVAKGEQALVLLGAADRDPEKFREPDRLDITRHPNDHLGFGAGAHSCFAAAVARMLSRIAIGTLVRRLDQLELDGEPAWQSTVTLRSLSKLPVRFSV